MHPTNYGIFIEPEGRLKASIEADKARVMDVCGNVPYVGHPVHMTLLAGSYDRHDLWLPQMVDVLLQAGREEEAYAMQRQRAESSDGTLADWGNLAMVYVRSGRPQSAKSVLSEMQQVVQSNRGIVQ